MDRKEVLESLNMLQKAIAEKQPSGNVISILQNLKENVVATEELLRVSLHSLWQLQLSHSSLHNSIA